MNCVGQIPIITKQVFSVSVTITQNLFSYWHFVTCHIKIQKYWFGSITKSVMKSGHKLGMLQQTWDCHGVYDNTFLSSNIWHHFAN